LVSRAVLQGYAELLPVGHFPVAVISLDLDPAALDVNIHPRKLEVRFTDEHRVFTTVTRAVREALLGPEALRHIPQAPPGVTVLPAERLVGPTSLDAVGMAGEGAEAVAMAAGVAETAPFYPPGPGPLPPMRLLGQILRTYLVAEVPGGLVLMDQHAAHERILYERLLRDATDGQGSAQMLAVPVPVDLSAAEAGVLDEFLPASARLGFTLEPFGGSTLLVRAVPAALVRRSPEAIVRRALAALIEPRDGDEAMQRLAIATACHTAVRAGDVLTAEEMAALLRDLAATEDPFTCFHGRPTMVRVSREALERWFLRR
jgi:DNA mismatch repair protein MutL